jgi:hypothetical protein
MNDTLDLLQQATVTLSQSGSIKDRLADAYSAHLIDVDADDLPECFRTEFTAMCAAMSRERPLPRESVARASVRKMSNEEAGRYAALVVTVFAALARSSAAAVATSRRKSRASQTAAPIVQLFAAEG